MTEEMRSRDHLGDRQAPPRGGACAVCKTPLTPSPRPGAPKRYCSRKCRDRAAWDRRKAASGTVKRRPEVARKRRPLPEFAKDAAWRLRADAERMERVFADDRFASHKEQLAALLRSQLAYTAEVCQDLLSRIDHLTGE